MQVTEIKVYPVREEKLKAFVSIVFDRCFMVNDIKVIRGREDLFISMPSRRKKNGKFKDVAHPLNNETRQMIEGLVLEEYRRAIGQEESPVAADAAPEEAPEAAPEAEAPAVESQPQESPVVAAPEVDERREKEPRGAQPTAEKADSSEGEEEEKDKSLEEVTELHLRDSFWST